MTNQMMMKEPKQATCEHCAEGRPIVRVTATTLDGTMLDTMSICRDCYYSATLTDVLAIGDSGGKSA